MKKPENVGRRRRRKPAAPEKAQGILAKDVDENFRALVADNDAAIKGARALGSPASFRRAMDGGSAATFDYLSELDGELRRLSVNSDLPLRLKLRLGDIRTVVQEAIVCTWGFREGVLSG